jgi:hypothetical protein
MHHGGDWKNHSADIQYKLTARLDMPGWVDVTATKKLPVIGHFKPQAVLASMLAAPAQSHTLEKSTAFFMKDGRLTAKMTLQAPQDALVLTGQETCLELWVHNRTPVPLTKIRVLLSTQVNILSHGHGKSLWLQERVLGVVFNNSASLGTAAATSGGGQPGNSAILAATMTEGSTTSVKIQLPHSAEVKHDSQSIKTDHFIVLELVPSGWLYRSLKLCLPVTVVSGALALKSVEAGGSSIPPSKSVSSRGRDAPRALDDTPPLDVQVALTELGTGGIASTSSGGHTPLHLAALRGHSELCASLIVAGCTLDAITKKGFSPLHSAAFGGDEATCIAIMSAAASIDSRGDSLLLTLRGAKTGKGNTAAELAAMEVPGE